ncbi:MAG: ArnT family glycosyltransferase [Candidatus Micrarchaeia archaeon]
MRIGKIIDRYQWYFLLVLLAFSTFLALYFLKGLSIYGDDVNYVPLVPSILSGTFKEFSDIFSIRLLMILPLALSVKIFGYNNYGAGMYSVFCYVATVAIVFLIGRKSYDAKTGLLAAFLYSIYPMSVRYSSTADVPSPTAFYIGLALLFFVYARKKRNGWYYILSGIFAFMATLVDTISYVSIFAFIACIILYAFLDAVKKRSLKIDYKPFLYILGLATAIVILGFLNIYLTATGEPFYEFNLTNSFYSATGKPNTIFYTNADLMFYVNGLLPYNFIGKVASNGLSGLANAVLSIFSLSSLNTNDVGLFIYFVILFSIYLVYKRDKESYFLMLFALISILYLEFGTMSITHYYPIYRLVRFTVIISIPIMLVLARGVMLLQNKKKNAFWGFLAAAIVILLFISSIPLDYFWYALNHNTMLYSQLIAEKLENASNISNSYIYAPTLLNTFVQYYMGFKSTKGTFFYNNGNYSGSFMPSCSSIPNDSYIIIPSKLALSYIDDNSTWPVPNPWYINESWAFNPSICNLTLYYDTYNSSQTKNLSIINLEYSGNIYYKK